jgi:hypothetical protein
MSAHSERRLAFLLGVLGAVLLALDALVRFALGVVFLATGHPFAAFGTLGLSVVFVVVAILIGFFSMWGRSAVSDRSLGAGVVLIVIAVLGWLVLGFSGSLLAVLAGVLTLVAGVLFLIGGR